MSSSLTPHKLDEMARWRWIAVSVLVLANVLNFLDRSLFAAAAPVLRDEFHLSNLDYGEMIGAFSLVYAPVALIAGALLDRFGLLRTVIGAVAIWSFGSAFTGMTSTFGGLLASRILLGAGEAAALPCLGKGTALYLPPAEWGFANSLGSVAVTLGMMSAPLLTAYLSPQFGWRSPFFLSGLIGFVWITVWFFTSRRIPNRFDSEKSSPAPVRLILSNYRLCGVAVAYAFIMLLYMFWLNWLTIYLVNVHHLKTNEANTYFTWIPPVLAVLGGLLSGVVSFRWIRAGENPLAARVRFCQFCAPVTLVNALVPFMASPRTSVLLIGLTMIFCMALITTVNVIPVDIFGPENAGVTTAVLAFSYALMQAFASPLIGRIIDHAGFQTVCIALSFFPLAGVTILHIVGRTNEAPMLVHAPSFPQ